MPIGRCSRISSAYSRSVLPSASAASRANSASNQACSSGRAGALAAATGAARRSPQRLGQEHFLDQQAVAVDREPGTARPQRGGRIGVLAQRAVEQRDARRRGARTRAARARAAGDCREPFAERGVAERDSQRWRASVASGIRVCANTQGRPSQVSSISRTNAALPAACSNADSAVASGASRSEMTTRPWRPPQQARRRSVRSPGSREPGGCRRRRWQLEVLEAPGPVQELSFVLDRSRLHRHTFP